MTKTTHHMTTSLSLVCEACNERPAITKDHLLCGPCSDDLNAWIDERGAVYPEESGDDEGACFAAGINTDPRF